MSPRQPAVLRGRGDSQNLRDHLIATARDMIEERGTASMTTRDIAREAQVADGVLYNYFADKEELIARATLMYVEGVMRNAGPPPEAGVGPLEENLRMHIDRALRILTRILPVFAGLLAEPKTIGRFHEIVGADTGEWALPAAIGEYLRSEQQLGRIDRDANVGAAATMLIGACHDLVVPRMLLGGAGADVSVPSGFADGLVATILQGIAPRSR